MGVRSDVREGFELERPGDAIDALQERPDPGEHQQEVGLVDEELPGAVQNASTFIAIPASSLIHHNEKAARISSASTVHQMPTSMKRKPSMSATPAKVAAGCKRHAMPAPTNRMPNAV